MGADLEDRVVFNLVWTERSFEYLGLFTLSLFEHSRTRVRFIANGCTPDEIATMEHFAAAYADRVTDVVVVSEDRTLRHGEALDAVRGIRDDGPYFSLIDPDIIATGPFMHTFGDALTDHDAVTAGKELWSDSNVLPEGHPGVNGEYFFRADGYVFGSPHFAIYDAALLTATCERWGIGLGSGGGNELSDDARARLEASGLAYWVYDTAKLVNICLQEDGGRLCHREDEHLLHIGGLLHYLWAPRDEQPDGTLRVDWATWKGMTARHEVARYTALCLRSLLGGHGAPPVPEVASPALVPRLEVVRGAVEALVMAFGARWLALAGEPPEEQEAGTSYRPWAKELRGSGDAPPGA